MEIKYLADENIPLKMVEELQKEKLKVRIIRYHS